MKTDRELIASLQAESFVDHLEEYIKREGLQGIIPEHRRQKAFGNSIVITWLMVMWMIPIAFTWSYREPKTLLVAAIVPPIVLAVLFVISAAGVAIRERKAPRDREMLSNIIAGSIAMAYPAVVSVLMGVYLGSFLAFVGLLGCFVLVVLLFVVMQHQVHRIYSLYQTIRLAWRMLQRSTSLLAVLSPLLLILVFFATMSQEFWEVMGKFPSSRLMGFIALIATPVLLLLVTSLKTEIQEIVGNTPPVSEIADKLSNVPLIRQKLEQGLISPEELASVRANLLWRNQDKVIQDVLPILLRRVRLVLLFLVFFTVAVVFAFFVLYFSALFHTLLGSSLIGKWVGNEAGRDMIISAFGSSLQVTRSFAVIVKVAALLSSVIAAIAVFYLFIDQNVQSRYKQPLGRELESWLAACCGYLSVLYPNYQIWRYRAKDSRTGIANVDVIVPAGTSRSEAEGICTALEEQHSDYRILLAQIYERNESDSYEWISHAAWRLTSNKSNGVREIVTAPELEPEEGIRKDHFLGAACEAQNRPIPDKWFGDSALTQRVAKRVWKMDEQRSIFLHSYAIDAGHAFTVVIRLKKRLSDSEKYRDLCRRMFHLMREMNISVSTYAVSVYFRDSPDQVARLTITLANGIESVDYRDEHLKSSRFERLSEWL